MEDERKTFIISIYFIEKDVSSDFNSEVQNILCYTEYIHLGGKLWHLWK